MTDKRSLLFREVNERIMEIGEPWLDGEARDLLCECGEMTCTEVISVARTDYRTARAHPERFLLASAHDGDTGMPVVERGNGYLITERSEEEAIPSVL
jgi:hypothetical protein